MIRSFRLVAHLFLIVFFAAASDFNDSEPNVRIEKLQEVHFARFRAMTVLLFVVAWGCYPYAAFRS